MGVPFIPVGFLRVCSSAMSMALVCCGTAPLHLGKQPNFFFPKGEKQRVAFIRQNKSRKQKFAERPSRE
jgi:hypothetical protein